MLLKVELPDGAYLADVGFGARVLDTPLRLELDVEQVTAMGTYRLSEADGLLTLSARHQGGWRTMYVFDLAPQLPADYELGNWYTSTHPLLPFVGNLILERVSGERRTKLINRRFVIEARDGEVNAERAIGSADELGAILDATFNVAPPAPVEEVFARLKA